jgi:hypothetical protein
MTKKMKKMKKTTWSNAAGGQPGSPPGASCGFPVARRLAVAVACRRIASRMEDPGVLTVADKPVAPLR